MGQMCTVVRPDEVVALERCGSFQGIYGPGFQWLGLDWAGMCNRTRRITTRIVEQRVSCETKTKDNVFVHLAISIQRELIRDSAFDAFYKLGNVDQQVDSYVSDLVRAQVPKLLLDDLFEQKDEIAANVKATLTHCMETFGIFIHQALVVDIIPDAKVKAAMNEINTNRRLRIAAAEKAEAQRIVIVKQAEAESESKWLQGQGIARQRAAIVEGLRQSIGCGRELEPEKVSELLLITQYFDCLEKVAAGKAQTTFISPGTQQMTDMRNGVIQAGALH